jgi:hypothetical protein
LNYRKYTDQDIIHAVSSSKSIAELCRQLGLKPVGGNYGTMHRHITRLKLDTSHFLDQAINLDREFKPFDNLGKTTSIRKRLIKERGYQCECCGLSQWFDHPIMIELHHVDGDRWNNDRSNLQLLCPNCHAMTDNWRNRNRKR